jgi:hypothetical protein
MPPGGPQRPAGTSPRVGKGETVDEGYQDLLDGKNIRGVIIHEH